MITSRSKLNNTSNKKLDQLLINDLHNTVSRNFDNDKRVYAVLTYVFKVLKNGEIKTPIVVLLSGDENETNHFLTHFGYLLNKHYNSIIATPLDISINAEQPQTRKELENNLFKYLQKNEINRVVIIRSIDNLRDNTPLLLHAASDPDTAPFKHLLAFLTVSPPTLNKSADRIKTQSQNSECDEKISK